jgi:hypothetical protein
MNNQSELNNQVNNPMNINQAGIQVNQMSQMIDLFRNNPQLLKEFNNLVTQNNQNYQNSNLLDESYLETASEGHIPRNAFKQYKNNDRTYIVEINDIFSNKMNIKFQLSSGNRINMVVPETISLKTLFEEFVRKIGFDKNILNEDIYFLYNGIKMDINDIRSVKDLNFYDSCIILVVDTKGILGA